MVLRFLTLLLAIVLMAGAAVQASASAGTPGAMAPGAMIDAPDAPDLEPAVLPTCSPPAPIAVSSLIVTPASPPVIVGRSHAVLVFRPPRLSALR